MLVDLARRAFNQRTLPVQIAWAGAAASAIGAAIAWLSANGAWPVVMAQVGGALAATLAGSVLAGRASRALREVAVTAAALRRHDGAQDANFPLIDRSAELRQATANLRRLVDYARQEKRTLEERNAALTLRLQHRTHELSTLQDLSIGLAAKSELHELVDEALGALEQTMDYASASLWARGGRKEGSQVVLLGYRIGEDSEALGTADLTGMRLSRSNLQRYEQIERERKPIIENQARQSFLSWLWTKVTDDARSSALYRASRSWMAVPLKFRDDVLGVMRVDHQEPDYFDAERERLLTAVGSQTALAMRHAQLLAREREMAVIAERNRIARDLHDAVSQTLFAANVMAGTLAGSMDRDPPPGAPTVKSQAQALERLNRGALAEMRLLMFELRPDALPDTPLADLLQQAIEALTCQGKVDVQRSLDRDDDFAAAARVALYRIAQEALSNIARHSGADHAVVEWRVHPGRQATLRIADNGQGFDPDAPTPGHFGLESMRSRAREIGAALTLISAPGNGVELRVELTPQDHGS
jgi:signal transduction histidine kinase